MQTKIATSVAVLSKAKYSTHSVLLTNPAIPELLCGGLGRHPQILTPTTVHTPEKSHRMIHEAGFHDRILSTCTGMTSSHDYTWWHYHSKEIKKKKKKKELVHSEGWDIFMLVFSDRHIGKRVHCLDINSFRMLLCV